MKAPCSTKCAAPRCRRHARPGNRFCSRACRMQHGPRDAQGRLVAFRPQQELPPTVYRRVAGDLDADEIERRFRQALAVIRYHSRTDARHA